LKHVYAQFIDDDAGRTLACASDAHVTKKGTAVEVAREVGKLVGDKAVELGIEKAVFDRGAYRYHGRVAAVADGAREAGIHF
jgi:large subunit ribosomal protein L18